MSYDPEPPNTRGTGLYAVDDQTGDLIAHTSQVSQNQETGKRSCHKASAMGTTMGDKVTDIDAEAAAPANSAVFVDIDYLEVVRGEVGHCMQGHRCSGWDDAERYCLQFELDRPQIVVTSVEMREVQ